MEPISYPLPEKALRLFGELAEHELAQVSWYAYLSFCLNNAGFQHAADWAHQQSKEERCHFNQLCDFMQTRGHEPEVPEVEQPKIPFTDLRSGIKAAYEKEVESVKMFDEAIQMMATLDTMGRIELESFLTGYRYALKRLGEMWAVFGDIETPDRQRMQESMFFAPTVETMPGI